MFGDKISQLLLRLAIATTFALGTFAVVCSLLTATFAFTALTLGILALL